MPRCLSALAALCLLTACPPLDPVWVTTDAIPAPVPVDPSDSESSTGALPTTSGDTDAVAADESTSNSPPTTSSADESTGSTGNGGEGSGGTEACWTDGCGEDLPCGKNLACLPHPISGAMVCASSDCFEGPCDGNPLACGETAPQGVCILNETKHGWCYPQVCVAVDDCDVGSTCVGGYCYLSPLLD